MQRILVTGGAGFIGSHLSQTLLEQGNQVVCLDNFNDYYAVSLKRANIQSLLDNRNFRLIENDILNFSFLKEYFSGANIDVVVHLAARAGVRPSIQQPLLYQKVNVEGTNNLLEVAKDFGVRKFIFASSSSVYGQNKKTPFSEDDPVDNPISPYASTKKAGELICYTYNHLYGLPVTCLRFFTVYGPRQRPDMAIRRFTTAVFHGQPITMYGDGGSRRDFTFITDIIDGILRSIEHCRGYHIYNLGESRTIELNRLIDVIAACLGREPIIERLPMQPGDVPLTFADITKARNEIGYQPKIGIEEGIGKFVNWFEEMERR